MKAWLDSPTGQRYQRFWTHFRISPQVLALFRLAFFAVLAVDMFLQVEHAPRYGSGDFNVGQFPFLDGSPLADRTLVTAGYLILSFLAARFALGVGGKIEMAAMTTIFGGIYFSSQLNSYQHHYLMFVVLLLCCFVPWRQSGDDKPSKWEPRRSAWAIRLLLVQVSIVYLFAAISKMSPQWWAGSVLAGQIQPGMIRDLASGIGFANAAKLVVLTELYLAVALHIARLRTSAAIIGIGLHIGIEVAGFDIGLFSYFMLAIYLLVLPERPIVALVDRASRIRLPSLPMPVWIVAWPIGSVLVGLAPFGAAAIAAAIIAALATGWLLYRPTTPRSHVALAHLVAGALIAALAQPQVTEVARNYYRFWGGNLRRYGQIEEATKVYERAVDADPDYAPSHSSLSKLYLMGGDTDRALRSARRAQKVDPGDYRGFLMEAMVHNQTKDGEAAVRAADQALERKNVQNAWRISNYWRKRLGMPPPNAGQSSDSQGDDD